MNRKNVMAGMATCVVVGLAGATPALMLTASSASAAPSGAPVPPIQVAVIASRLPKTVVLDPSTGAVVSVTLDGALDLASVTPDIIRRGGLRPRRRLLLHANGRRDVPRSELLRQPGNLHWGLAQAKCLV